MHLTLLILGLILSVTYAYKANDDKKLDESITTQEIEDEIEEILAASTDEEQDEFYSDVEKTPKTKNDPFLFGRRRRRRRSCAGPSKSRCNIGVRYNGCGSGVFTKIRINAFSKETLYNACIKHDVCYNCGKYKGWSQKACDNKFYSDSKKVCDCKNSEWYQTIERGACHAAALSMYGIVRAAGSSFYLQNSHDYCSTTNTCLNDFSPNSNVFKK